MKKHDAALIRVLAAVDAAFLPCREYSGPKRANESTRPEGSESGVFGREAWGAGAFAGARSELRAGESSGPHPRPQQVRTSTPSATRIRTIDTPLYWAYWAPGPAHQVGPVGRKPALFRRGV